MTTPTQAQIEAAAAAIENLDPFEVYDCTKAAEAALAAAAQVGEPSFGPWWEEAKRTIERDAVERCAQVAEQIRDCDYQSMLKIAAAIRKLKEQP